MDADRLMMQLIQTSLSLIGFGFTINAFFNQVADQGISADANQTARRLGLSLLCLGLFFLAMGIINQARLRLSIRARYRNLPRQQNLYSAAPSFILAVLLLLVGLAALGSIVSRMWLRI